MWSWRRTTGGLAAAVLLTGLAATGCSGDDGDGAGGGGSDEPSAEESSAERAPGGVVQVLMPDDVEVSLDPLTGAVGTETQHLTVVAGGEVDEIGTGRAARRPAEGERFVVVELEKQTRPAEGAVDRIETAEMEERGKATFGVKVGGAAPVAVNLDVPSYTPLPIDLDEPPTPPTPADPAEPQRRLLVVSVPEDAEEADLLVTSPGLEQSISLLTGEPAAENVAVLARANRRLAGDVPPQEVTYTNTEFGVSAGGTQAVKVVSATLQWSVGSGATRRTAPPGRALLQVVLDISGFNFGLATELRLPDGTVVQPLPAQDEILASIVPGAAFEVPADLDGATLVFGKDYTWEVPTGGGNFTVDFVAPVEFPLSIPAIA